MDDDILNMLMEQPTPDDELAHFIGEVVGEILDVYQSIETRVFGDAEKTLSLARDVERESTQRVRGAVGKLTKGIGDLQRQYDALIDPSPDPQPSIPEGGGRPTGENGCPLDDPQPPTNCRYELTPVDDCHSIVRVLWTNVYNHSFAIVEIPELGLSVDVSPDRGDQQYEFPYVNLSCQVSVKVRVGCRGNLGGEFVSFERDCALVIPRMDSCPAEEGEECFTEPTDPPEEDPLECSKCCCCPCECGGSGGGPTDPDKVDSWCVYRTADETQCYVKPCSEGPTDQEDRYLGEFKTRGDANRAAAALCGDDGEQDPGGEGEGLAFAKGPGFCSPDSYDRLTTPEGEFLTVFKDLFKVQEGVKKGWSAIKSPLQPFMQGELNPFSAWMELLFGFVDKGIKSVEGMKEWAKLTGCDPDRIGDYLFPLSAANFMRQWLGADVDFASVPLKYLMNRTCPYFHPTTEQAISAYIGGEIDEHRLRVTAEMNGSCFEPLWPIVQASRTKLPPGILTQALYRGLIDRTEFDRELRAQGHLDPKQADVYQALGKFIPPPTDLIRMMVRDVEDPDIEEQFKLSDDFGDKYRGLLREFAEQQGMSEETMLRYWKAHWSIPSPTQLYEMLHRLRRNPDENLRTDEDTVITALKQQDILPYWIDRLVAISYNPLTRVDTRRAYELGDIDEDQVRRSYEAQGYNDDDTDILVKYSRTLKEEGIESQKAVKYYAQGVMSRDEAIRELQERGFDDGFITVAMERIDKKRLRSVHAERPYRQFLDGLLDEFELRRELLDRNYPPADVDTAVNQARNELERKFRTKCEANIRQRYLWGEIDDEDAKAELRGLGAPAIYSEGLAGQWKCEVETGEKQGTLREFYRWLEYGTADKDEIRTRLRRLRYSEKSANLIVATMVERLKLRDEKEAEKIRKAEIAEQRRRDRERKRNSANLERRMLQGQRLREAQEKAKAKRAQTISKAATDFATAFSLDVASTGERFANLQEVVRGLVSVGLDNQVGIIKTAAEQAIKTANPDIEGVAIGIAQAYDEWFDDVES